MWHILLFKATGDNWTNFHRLYYFDSVGRITSFFAKMGLPRRGYKFQASLTATQARILHALYISSTISNYSISKMKITQQS